MQRIKLKVLLTALAIAAVAHSAQAARKGSFNAVVIDPGHGGFDPGGIPQNLIPEKGVALDVAKRLQRRLEDAGLNVVMTRTTDVFIPLPERVAIANARKHAIFVSIHFNAALRTSARGIETYYCSPAGVDLATRIERHAMTTTDGEYRGIKHANYYVLRKNKLLAVLVECGFLTDPQDTRLASSATYREALARQIAAAILEYHRKF